MKFTSLPILARDLGDFIPHRPPMVWIDEVIELQNETAVCRTTLSPDRPYYSEEVFRPSTYIEWMAQAFAFSEAARIVLSPENERVPPLKTTFLVGVTGAVFAKGSENPKIGKILVKTTKTHVFKPLFLFKGEVLSETGELLAEASYKVFGE